MREILRPQFQYQQRLQGCCEQLPRAWVRPTCGRDRTPQGGELSLLCAPCDLESIFREAGERVLLQIVYDEFLECGFSLRAIAVIDRGHCLLVGTRELRADAPVTR